MIDGQLKLSFGNVGECHSMDRRQRRINRAQWWFERMRQVVDRAFEPVRPARPEQIWFPNAHRQAGAISQPHSAARSSGPQSRERQICE